ncbi:MAG: heavy-metal-associated domain-containing protein [Burkholderiales bacterium]
MQTAVIKVNGMTCGGCVRSVTRVLQAVQGVESVNVSLERGEAALTYDPAKADIPQFRKVIEEAGFEAG